MWIERIQVEEGFLNGLDIYPTAGLNVLIGARGTGKTSLIELIRYCLDVPGYTPESNKRSRDHALSVLGGGQVTITLVDQGRRIVVSRSGYDDAPRASGPYLPPIILSQTEIETVGLQPSGRLRVLDGFLGDLRHLAVAETEAVTAVKSYTLEANSIRQDIDRLWGQLSEIPSLDAQIAELAPQEAHVAQLSAEASARSGELGQLSHTVAVKGVALSAIERFREWVTAWREGLVSHGAAGAPPEPWPEGAGHDPLGEVRANVGTAHQLVHQAIANLIEAEAKAAALATTLLGERIGFEDKARELRRHIESLQAGAGDIVRRGHVLRERRAQLQSLVNLHQARWASLSAVIERRSEAFERLEAIRFERFHARLWAAARLTEVLAPRINVQVLRGGQVDTFAAAIAEALRGSGLRYNDLAQTLAERISPRELLEAVERDDYALIANCASTSTDRAAKAVIALKESDLSAIATTVVDDYVSFSLLDGVERKDISDLSTGQRCTVVLPMVLRHTDRVLIVDQPEDHIDNAFIVDTLIKAVRARSVDGQIIFSTHNANIPVLGGADLVLQLGSDGKRGFPVVQAPLSDRRAAEAITALMEGGAEAFQLRASFYANQL